MSATLVDSVAGASPGSGGGDVVLTHGFTIAENDVLVAFGVSGNTASRTISPPGDWIELEYTQRDTIYHTYVWYKVAGASEPSSYTWTGFDSSTSATVIMVQLTGAENPATNAPEENYTFDTTAPDTNKTCPAVTVSDDDSIVLLVCFDMRGTTTFTQPGSTTLELQIDPATTNPKAGALAYLAHNAGSTGTFDFVVSPDWHAFGFWTATVAFAPTEGGGGDPPSQLNIINIIYRSLSQ